MGEPEFRGGAGKPQVPHFVRDDIVIVEWREKQKAQLFGLRLLCFLSPLLVYQVCRIRLHFYVADIARFKGFLLDRLLGVNPVDETVGVTSRHRGGRVTAVLLLYFGGRVGDRRDSIFMERHERKPVASVAQRVFEVADGDVLRRESGERYGDGDGGVRVAGAVELAFVFAVGGEVGEAGCGG